MLKCDLALFSLNRGLHFSLLNFSLLHHCRTCPTQKQGDDVTDRLKDHSGCLAHNLTVLNGELLGLFSWSKPPLLYNAKLQKNPEITKRFPDYFHSVTSSSDLNVTVLSIPLRENFHRVQGAVFFNALICSGFRFCLVCRFSIGK